MFGLLFGLFLATLSHSLVLLAALVSMLHFLYDYGDVAGQCVYVYIESGRERGPPFFK